MDSVTIVNKFHRFFIDFLLFNKAPLYSPLLSLNFFTFTEPKNRFQGINSGSLCSLAGLYDNPVPIRFPVPIDCLKIPSQISAYF
jgi:hypothetical protein